MWPQTIILRGLQQRALSCGLVNGAPVDAVVTIREPGRNLDQNAKMWAMLSDVSRAKVGEREWTTDTWKAALMHACGHQIVFCEGLDGSGPFPMGFRTSALSKRQMADLITYIGEYGDRHGVPWSEPDRWAR